MKVLDCANPYISESRHDFLYDNVVYDYKYKKITNVNWFYDDVELVSAKLVKINNNLYDPYFSEFERLNIDKTNNLGNNVDVSTFLYVGSEESYFKDKNKYYYGDISPNYNCFSTNEEDFKRAGVKPLVFPTLDDGSQLKEKELKIPEPYFLEEFYIDTPEVEKLLSENRKHEVIIEKEPFSYYNNLNNVLYYRASSTKFLKVSDVDPKTIRKLADYIYTDGKIILVGATVIKLDPSSFSKIPIKCFADSGYITDSEMFFKVEGDIYYLDRIEGLLRVDADVVTFEAVNNSSVCLGAETMYRDKNYIYTPSLKNGSFIINKVER